MAAAAKRACGTKGGDVCMRCRTEPYRYAIDNECKERWQKRWSDAKQ